jgi:hypothetical protein
MTKKLIQPGSIRNNLKPETSRYQMIQNSIQSRSE